MADDQETASDKLSTYQTWLESECGHIAFRPLPGGRYASVLPFIFTAAIVIGRVGDLLGYDDRWCYHSVADAVVALNAWNGIGEPEGWHRHPATGRRVSEFGNEVDNEGREVREAGVLYVLK